MVRKEIKDINKKWLKDYKVRYLSREATQNHK